MGRRCQRCVAAAVGRGMQGPRPPLFASPPPAALRPRSLGLLSRASSALGTGAFLVSPTDRMNPVQGGAKGGRRVLISEVAKAGESISYVVGCLLCGNPTSLSSVPSCQPKSPTQGAAISAGLCSRRRRRIRGAAPPPPCDDSAPPSAATSLPSCPSRSARGRALATLARSARQFAGAARLDENAPPWVSCGGRASGAALRGGGGRGGGSHPPCPPCPPSPPVSRPSSP